MRRAANFSLRHDSGEAQTGYVGRVGDALFETAEGYIQNDLF